jgi:DNA-directed RNA polymerase subunit RPC12/RpoP
MTQAQGAAAKPPCKDCGGAVESFYRAPVCTQCRHKRALARKGKGKV